MRDEEKTAPNPRALGWVCYKKKNRRFGSHTFILTTWEERGPLEAEDIVTRMASHFKCSVPRFPHCGRDTNSVFLMGSGED